MSQRNIILICLDTVRKDTFDKYADRIQRQSDITVEQCRAASSWTVPSHASMFTGQLPHQHGVHAHNIDFTSIPVTETFLSDLSAHQAVCVSANPYFDSNFGADTLFDELIDITASVVYSDGMYLRDFASDRNGLLQYGEYLKQALQHDHPVKSLINGVHHGLSLIRPSFLPRFGDDGGRAVVEEVVRQVSRIKEPYFAFVNFMDAHGPFSPSRRYDSDMYSAPTTWSSHEIDFWEVNTNGLDETHEPDLTYYRELYAASVDYLDQLVDELIDRVTDTSSRETTFIITSDHGENLGFAADNHLLEHKGSLTEGLLHVPLTIVNPPQSFESNSGSSYVSQLSLGDLVVGLANDELVLESSGQIPAELVGLGATDPPLDDREHQYWNRMIRCVYHDNSKLMWDSIGNISRYTLGNTACSQELAAPPDEIPYWASQSFDEPIRAYKERTAARSNKPTVNKPTQDRLEDLGYL